MEYKKSMRIAGIIAEYNPFHNGHLYQLKQTKSQGATHTIAVMSGSFVQRGDVALCSKWARAKMALLNGVDLVIELPTQYALSSANTFARAGVFLLNELGIDLLSFGSEEGDAKTLKKVAKSITVAEQSREMSNFLKDGDSYPRAREKAVQSLYGDHYAEIMTKANNALGIEYLRAINQINPNIQAVTIKREQAEHDSGIAGKDIASASYLRELVEKNEISSLKQFMPSSAFAVLEHEIERGLAPVMQANLNQALLYCLRKKTLEEFSLLPDVSEGLENRLYRMAQIATSVEKFYDIVKTKRYTHARIRRIAYSALLDIQKENQIGMPKYIRVLGANEKGFEILAKAKETVSIPFATKFASLYEQASSEIEIDIRATDIYSLAQPKVQPGKQDFINNTIIIK